jgi:hypothetical protein
VDERRREQCFRDERALARCVRKGLLAKRLPEQLSTIAPPARIAPDASTKAQSRVSDRTNPAERYAARRMVIDIGATRREIESRESSARGPE